MGDNRIQGDALTAFYQSAEYQRRMKGRNWDGKPAVFNTSVIDAGVRIDVHHNLVEGGKLETKPIIAAYLIGADGTVHELSA